MSGAAIRVFIAGTMLGLGGLAAAAEPLSMRFDVYVSGLKVMKVKFNGDISASGYAGEASMRPKGFVGFFLKKKLDMRVKGRFNGRQVQPVSFWIRSRKKKREKTASVAWSAGLRPTSWQRTPAADAGRRAAIMAAIAQGAVDPLSLLFSIGRRDSQNPCAGRMRIFDGLTVYDIRLQKVGQERIRSGYYTGSALKCRLIYIPVAGMSDEKKHKYLKAPPVFTAWLARVQSAAGPILVPVQAAGRMKGRPFTARLSAAALGGSSLRPVNN